MPEIKRILKNVDVQYISLVKKGANQKIVLWKSEHAENESSLPFNRKIKIQKTDDEKQMVYGIVYSPGEPDSEGDIVLTPDEIEKMAFNFMKNGRTTQVDKQHDYNPDEGYVAESWITKENDPLFPDDPVGSWAVGIKVEDENTWQEVKKGEITGLSLAGTAEVEDVQPENPAQESLLFKVLKKIGVKKDFNSKIAKFDFYQIIDAFQSAVYEIFSDDYTGDRKQALLDTIDQMRAYVEEKVTLEKAGATFSKKNLEKIKAAHAALTELIKLTEKNVNLNKENSTMSNEEIKKAVEEAVKPLNDKIEELQKSLDDVTAKKEELEKTVKEQAERIEKIEKATPGKQSKDGQEDLEKSEEEPMWI